ncbi:transcriptional adapter 2B isoform X1 [Folsomia candida]|uniref:Transcriptional adapter 2B n=1 Tax=Folsomia candida TaxID=158441 RepID=A0A226D1L7_FOLCA|nr:transcriptional adapter 2B isoform X1 [Folsomia candida]OXA38960.1 Transcriptional adapter 2B [Folsomia candida]
MLYYEELFTRSSCLNCRYEISGLGVECSECQPQGAPFRLCAECFASGTEIGSHKKEHPYRYFDSGSLALFPGSRQDISSSKENNSSSTTNAPTTSNRWSAREEIRLLDAIEQYGFGNWQDISKHIESRGAIEAKEEFVHRHVDGNVGKVSWAESNNSSAENKWSSEFKGSVGIFPQPIDHTSPGDEGPLSPSLTQRLPPLDISSDEMLQLGYMPFRDDYEKEYDNEAEKLVSQLNFTPEDDELEIGLKLALVDLYSARLRERARRKRVIRDYQLVCKFFKKDRAKKAAGIGALNSDADGTEPGGGNKETVKKFQISEKQLQEKFRPFSQFYNSREFDNLARNLVKEKDLRLRLSELFKYRNVGITRGEECIEFERSRGPSGQGNGLRKRPAASAGLGTVEEEDDEDRGHKKGLMMTQSPALIQQLLQQQTPNPTRLELGNEENVDENASVTPNPILQLSSKGGFNLRSSESNGLEVALLPQMPQEGVTVPAPGQPLQKGGLSLLSEQLRGTGDLFIADKYIPGIDVVTTAELDLCTKINLYPSQFLSIKLAFMLGQLTNAENNNSNPDENSYAGPPSLTSAEWNLLLPFLLSSQ